MSFNLPANSNWAYLDANGQIALTVLNDDNASPTYIHPDGSTDTGPFQEAPVNTTIKLYADGNVESYDSFLADGTELFIQYADSGPFFSFGPGNEFTHGTRTAQTYFSAPDINGHLDVTAFTFDAAGDITSASYTLRPDGNTSQILSTVLSGTFNPLANTSTLVLNPGSGSQLSQTALGNIDRLLQLPTAYVISNDGGSLVGQDGAGLVGQDGAGIIATGGGNTIAQGGGNLVGQDGAGVIATGGGNLLSEGGNGILSSPTEILTNGSSDPPPFVDGILLYDNLVNSFFDLVRGDATTLLSVTNQLSGLLGTFGSQTPAK